MRWSSTPRSYCSTSKLLPLPVRICSHKRHRSTRAPSVPPPISNHYLIQRRKFSFNALHPVILAPTVFTCLVLSLWTYKCLMMVIFQNKIIYMPSMPPFSRSEKVADYAKVCKPVLWVERDIRSSDGTKLAVLEGHILPDLSLSEIKVQRHVVILYFQGNGSSTPPRLPMLSNVLKQLHEQCMDNNGWRTSYSLFALSYRGYWHSSGRPSQAGIELDAQAAIEYVYKRYSDIPFGAVKIVLWGQSIGAGVATAALATRYGQSKSDPEVKRPTQNPSETSSNLGSGPSTYMTTWPMIPTPDPKINISALLLETPFTSLRSMLLALYPQKWLPYRYLGPFLKSTWDSSRALTQIVEHRASNDDLRKTPLKVLLVEAGNDELVPSGEAKALEQTLLDAGHRRDSNIQVAVVNVSGAYHTNVLNKAAGRKAVVEFLKNV